MLGCCVALAQADVLLLGVVECNWLAVRMVQMHRWLLCPLTLWSVHIAHTVLHLAGLAAVTW
jgi:hypothetical protein